MNATFGPGSSPLVGELHVPGDKSMSHRAVLFSAIADGTTTLRGVLDSADVSSTIGAVRELGAHVDLAEQPDGSLGGAVTGWGSACPLPWGVDIDCGNSGTTARLLLGVLAGWPTKVTLRGDESLSRRPMRRVMEPLARMGAHFSANAAGTLPVTVQGNAALTPIDYASPVASAQVKTAVLLAGLRAQGETRVSEPSPSRDHTERMLPEFGVAVKLDPQRHAASVIGPVTPISAGEIVVPRDSSSAAFFVCAALLVTGSEVLLPGVSLNETRTGFLRVIERMGAQVEAVPWPISAGERMGALVTRYTATLSSTVVTAAEVPSLVDEVPILALVATQATGETRFEDVGELRVKESDRFEAVLAGLTALGGDVRAEGDTLVIKGPTPLHAATLDSRGDHRLAMTWAVAGLVADGPVEVERFEAVAVSYPRFVGDLESLMSAEA